MTQAQFATGNNNAAGLANLNVEYLFQQPFQSPLEPVRRRYPASGIPKADGDTQSGWRFSGLTRAAFNALNTQFGVSATTPAAAATFKLRQNDATTWANYNGTIEFPKPGQLTERAGGWIDVEYSILNLEAL